MIMGESPFDKVADDYDSWYVDNPDALDLEREAISQMMMGGRVLDVGCGTGMLTPPGALGLDISLPMLRRAMDRDIEVVMGRAEDLPFRDASFDHVLMTATISFLHDRLSSREIARAAHGRNIGIRNGHMYAHRLCKALGLDPEDGVVRVSLVHYNTPDEIDRLIEVFEEVL